MVHIAPIGRLLERLVKARMWRSNNRRARWTRERITPSYLNLDVTQNPNYNVVTAVGYGPILPTSSPSRTIPDHPGRYRSSRTVPDGTGRYR